MDTSTVDTAISEVTRQAMLWRKESREQLAALLGLSLRSVARRLVGDIPWEAREIAVMAEHFGLPITTFYAGPDALFQAAGEGTGAPMNRRYDGESMEVTADPLLIPDQRLALTA